MQQIDALEGEMKKIKQENTNFTKLMRKEQIEKADEIANLKKQLEDEINNSSLDQETQLTELKKTNKAI